MHHLSVEMPGRLKRLERKNQVIGSYKPEDEISQWKSMQLQDENKYFVTEKSTLGFTFP
jgi:hypothetical protein